MHRHEFIICIIIATSIISSFSYSGEASGNVKNEIVKIHVDIDHPDAIYQIGEKVTITARLTIDDMLLPGGYLKYSIERECTKNDPEYKKLPMDENGSGTIQLATEDPGFIRVRFKAGRDDKYPTTPELAKKIFWCQNAAVVGVAPEKIRTALPEPIDFDSFWDNARSELKSVPLKVLKYDEVPLTGQQKQWFEGKIKAYDFRLSCPGPRPASGILAIPTNAAPKSLLAIISLHGAGVFSSGIRSQEAARHHAIVIDLNAHGLENGHEKEYYKAIEAHELKDYLYHVGDQKENNYFKYMFLRILRALEYVKQMPEWDGKNIIVSGGSQGGAQALAAAGLDPDVTLCIATIPWLTCQNAVVEGRFHPYWPQVLKFNKDNQLQNPEIIDNLKYFDNANFAKRIKGRVVIAYGLLDEVCPPSGVWITYNNIPGTKSIHGYPQAGHGDIFQYMGDLPGSSIEKYLKEGK